MHIDDTGRNGLLSWLTLHRLLLTLMVMLSLGSPALAEELTYSYGGDANWFTQSVTTHDGVDAYQSGLVSNSQSSWMETTVSGPGAIRFWWKVSSESCCDPLRFSIDGTSQADIRGEVGWQSQAFVIPSGSHTLRWSYSTDGSVLTGSNAGWLDQVSFTPGSGIDVTPPVTTATPAGGTYGSSQSVTLTASEPATIYYTTNGSDPTTSSTQYTSPLAIGTSTVLKFMAVDGAGNYELVKTATYTFDTTPPSTYVSPAAGTYSGARNVSLNCSDFGMGCNNTYYCLGSGCTPTTLYSSAIAIAASTELRYYSVDNGGNSEAVKTQAFTITPDVTAPATTSDYTSGTYSPTSLYLFCNDGAGSGCATTYYCQGSGCTPTTPYNGPIYLSASTDLRFYSVDRAGNSEAVTTYSYTIDSTPPTTTPGVGGGIYASPQNVTLSCSDGAGSGCSATYYCLGTGCYPGTRYSGPIAVSASTYLTFYSQDNVRNDEAWRSVRYNITTAPPATIHVPADRGTIQAAIDAANDGDTVLVAPGTYVENINFNGKAITVQSSDGPDATIIDGNQQGSVVVFSTYEWTTSVLSGFTIRNGGQPPGYSGILNGGGIYIHVASPTITNNKIVQNQAFDGAGIYAGGSPIIRGNLISGNHRKAGYSGGYGGGGIYLCGDSAQVVDNTISDNALTYAAGGGIYVACSGNDIVRGNVISRNGGIGVRGGGIYVDGSTTAQIVQNLVVDNSASYGGGVFLTRGILLANNTVAGNDAMKGSGVYVDRYSWGTGLIINNVISGKTGQTVIHSESNRTYNPPLKNNILFSPSNDVYGGTYSDQTGINGNISADPQLSGAAFGYYGLRTGSPAIDAGDNAAPALPATDLSGAPRLIAGTPQGPALVDIGAYEYDPDEPRAVLTGAPTGATTEASASLTVGGAGIVSYRYAIDGAQFGSADMPVSTPIELSGLAGGTHAVAVIGTSAAGTQRTVSATVAEWTIDTVPPVTTASPGSGTYTTPQTVTLSCDDGSGGGCAGTFYCLGAECTPTTPYTAPIAVANPAGLRYYSRDAFGHQEAVNTASYGFVGTISGRVTDGGTGNGVAGVDVVAYSAATGAFVGYGNTDSSGNYQFAGLTSGNYKVQFFGSGYIKQWYSGKSSRSAAVVVTLSAPTPTTGIDAVMIMGGTITGTVTDKDTGAGIQGVYIATYDALTGAMVGSGMTDNSGAYSIPGLATGTYKLCFEALYNPGYLNQWYSGKAGLSSATAVAVTVGTTTSGINAALRKGGSITGTVTDSVSGAAISGVYVSVVDAGTGLWMASTSTDSSGGYTLMGLSGSYKLNFSGVGYLDTWYGGASGQSGATVVAVTAPGTTGGINMALVKGGTITGRITDRATGVGIQGAYLTAYNSVTGTWVSSGHTDSSGAYSLSSLPTGTYKLHLGASGYMEQWLGGNDQASAASVAVTAPNTTAGIDAALVKGGSISGTVTDSSTGAGIESAQVTAYDAVTGEWVASASTDPNGNYTVAGLTSGDYRLSFTGSGYLSEWHDNKTERGCADAVSVTAPATSGGINASLLRGGSISGRVMDAVTGAGVAGISVNMMKMLDASSVSSGNGITAAFYGGLARIVSDANGDYTVRGLSSGDYAVGFSGKGYVGQWYDGKTGRSSATRVTVTAPDAVAGINAALAKGGGISGRITDSVTGAGIEGVWVYAYDAASNSWITGTDTDASGAYSIDALPTGNYKLQFYGDGSVYADGWFDGAQGIAEATTVSVTAPAITTGVDAVLASLQDRGGIAGKVTDHATGAPITWLQVSAIDTVNREVAHAYTDSAGAYTLKGLPAGTYKVGFDGSPYVSRWFPDAADVESATAVTVKASEATAGIDMALTKGGSISGVVMVSTCPAPGSFSVVAYDATTGKLAGESWVTPEYSAKFTIGGLPSGNYKVEIDTRDTGFVRQWYSDKPDLASADPVAVSAPDTTGGMEIRLVAGAIIAGRLTDISGNPVPFIMVDAYDAVSGSMVASTFSSPSGSYALRGLPSGSYKILFAGNYRFAGQWYKTQPDLADPSVITVSASVDGIDAVLARRSPSTPPRGDVNGDGTVDIADALVALKICVGLVTPTADELLRGDVAPLSPSSDGKIDLLDALVILKRVVGLIGWDF